MTTLGEIGEWLEKTELVPIDAARTRAVLGDGSPTADLMLIGEAPGADEDRQGLPFVGRAGRLLTQILNAIGLERSDVYITNVVKSRPPNNRDPLPEEVEAHLPILYRQISIIKPRLILALGRISATTLLGRTASISSMRGTFHDFHGIPLVVTYHPAALLRDPKWKRPTWEDVQMLKARYDELTGAASSTDG
jgi:DNA polymerase